MVKRQIPSVELYLLEPKEEYESIKPIRRYAVR